MGKGTSKRRPRKLVKAQEQYDVHAKSILSRKQFLARIMLGTMSEFAGMSPEAVEACIEGTPSVGVVAVAPGKTNAEDSTHAKVSGLANEDKVAGEGTVYYDIKTYVTVPHGNERIRVIVNVEAQKSFNPGYKIVTRGLYYAARLLSAQLETEFEHSHYEDLKKVYSIWVCMNAPKSVGNAMSRYRIIEETLRENLSFDEEDYDKLDVVIIALRDGDDVRREHSLHGMLNTIFTSALSKEGKREALDIGYNVHMDEGTYEELGEMCNISEYILEQGMAQGMAQGMEQGLEQGKERERNRLIRNSLISGASCKAISRMLGVDIALVRQISKELKKESRR